jgi:glycosyltransferase involved in cell wall biosynthesis
MTDVAVTRPDRASPFRVLLGVPWYFPDSVGGTEVHVRGLARKLIEAGIDVAVASPAQKPDAAATYVHDGIRVFRYPVPYATSGEIDANRPEPREWCEVLDRFAPAIVDLHSLTSGLELAHLKAARHRGAQTIVTFHVPGVICARGPFMRFGKTPCRGDIDRQPCTACRLEQQGLPQPLARMIGAVPPRVAQALGASPLPGAALRALTAAARDGHRRAWLREIFRHADRLVAPSKWLVDVLLANGAHRDKVVLCRQGVDLHPATAPTQRSEATGPIRVGFLGRYDPVKGLHILIDAVKATAIDIGIELHVWGLARWRSDEDYRRAMLARAAGDRRVIFHDESTRPADAYNEIDVLAVPSVWLETGPLVVLEAQAAGLPVVGSNIGGIPERIVDGVNGLLLPPGDVGAWANALASLAADPARLEALRPSESPRTVADVARETLRTYEALLVAHAA